MSEIYNLVKQAIEEKKQIHAVYKGKNRKLCPHVIGLNKGGEEQAQCYQFEGGSNSGSITSGSDQNWRCLLIKNLSEVTIHEGEWYTANNYSPDDKCVSKVDLSV